MKIINNIALNTKYLKREYLDTIYFCDGSFLSKYLCT
jgi:hypothetical protein